MKAKYYILAKFTYLNRFGNTQQTTDLIRTTRSSLDLTTMNKITKTISAHYDVGVSDIYINEVHLVNPLDMI